MAHDREMAAKQLGEITECPICMSTFLDPRMLPCIHTFCFECLKCIVEVHHKVSGDKMLCPTCRMEFLIPGDGVSGLQKNFFMENLIECKTKLQVGSDATVCDICKASEEAKPGEVRTAAMRCMECQDNYCDNCLKVHKFQKLSRNHRVVKIGSASESGTKQYFTVKYCIKHTLKPLDYYCAECKKIVCVSCFVESHKLHDCKDITTVEEEFCQMIEKKAGKISNYADEMMSKREKTENRKADLVKEIEEKEQEIHKRSQELKSLIDENTKSILEELSVIKVNRLKEIENEVEEIDRCCTILGSFEAYCTELRLKGSASDICSSIDQLVSRADEFEKDHEAFMGRPHQSVEISFKATDLGDVLQKANNNVVGQVTETVGCFENYAIIVGMSDGTVANRDIVGVNLHRQTQHLMVREPPFAVKRGTTASVYCNTIYITGIGRDRDEIWKYNQDSGWVLAAYLDYGRRRHSAAFINEVMYICGGSVDAKSALNSVEAYNAVTHTCVKVGKLFHGVKRSGNCVPYKGSLYIFGGLDKDDKEVNHVQVYNTYQNTCSLLPKPLPKPCYLVQAALSGSSVILLAENTCFIYNIESETWLERKQFQTDVIYFGLVLVNERVFVLGGGMDDLDEDDDVSWECINNIRYVPLQNILIDKPIEWRNHGKLSKPSLVYNCVNVQYPV